MTKSSPGRRVSNGRMINGGVRASTNVASKYDFISRRKRDSAPRFIIIIKRGGCLHIELQIINLISANMREKSSEECIKTRSAFVSGGKGGGIIRKLHFPLTPPAGGFKKFSAQEIINSRAFFFRDKRGCFLSRGKYRWPTFIRNLRERQGEIVIYDGTSRK